ncbi:BTB-domain-containing protein [Rhizophagus irregularis]|uniref:BTB-domain-containing protein n=1 Tax=Rhizophagus irregularis TaxID=588596 RepID=A0A2I1G0W1_9GLOM|nr:BTB-domain-containing protein [Rhizophagus irregularis]
MATQFLPKLSKNYIELLENGEYYDITVEVGKDPNVKFIRAHKSILCSRSPHLRRALTSKNDDNVLATKLPNISPEIFQIILRYIYGGILPLNELEASDVLKVLLAADELLLQELVDYLQNYLIENESQWIEQHFELVHRTSFQFTSLTVIQQFCTNLMAKSPDKIFNSLDFTSIPERSLVQLIKRDDLQMKEIDVWERVLKWGIAQNPTLLEDPNTWSDNDFKTIENTLQHCLPFIRFFCLSSKEFLQKVHPYKKLLRSQFYEELLNSQLDPDIKPNDDISLPRNIEIDSNIVNNLIISHISKCIDKKVIIDNKFAQIRELYLPYKLELLLRGSRDGFTPKRFHELCDNKPNTVVFIKVKETEEIIGGYNPLIWENSDTWGNTKDSFIFSFKKENMFFKDVIISKVENLSRAINNFPCNGPCFGDDIFMNSTEESADYSIINCKKVDYEKNLRDTGENFQIDDYESEEAGEPFEDDDENIRKACKNRVPARHLAVATNNFLRPITGGVLVDVRDTPLGFNYLYRAIELSDNTGYTNSFFLKFALEECYNQLANAVIQESQNQGLVFTVNPGKSVVTRGLFRRTAANLIANQAQVPNLK